MMGERKGRTGLAALLAGGMAFAMFPGAAIGILSSFMIDDLGLSRADIGAVATGFFLVEAGASLPLGGVADRQGGKRMLLLVLASSALGLGAMSVAWGMWPLIVFAGLAGLAPAGANPATNHLIIEHIPPGSRGWITGIKQSGVQVGIFAGGVGLPPLALALGWRWAIAISALVGVGITAVALAFLPAASNRKEVGVRASSRNRLPGTVRWLAAFGMLMGVGVGALGTYLPLYAQEAIGLSVAVAGWVIAVFGVVGLVARIAWGRIAERAAHPATPLGWIASLTFLSWLFIWGATPQAPALLWIGAVLAGVGSVSWMSVGMLAVMTTVEPERAGRGSAAVTLGFAVGLTAGPIAFGTVLDATGSYASPFAGLVVMSALAAALTVAWRRADRRDVTDAFTVRAARSP
jgi:predicted MFS family arabinose efflux permease